MDGKIKNQARLLLELHLEGSLSTNEFLHMLNRLITTRKEEPTTITEIEDDRWLVCTTSARLIANILSSDAVVDAREKDSNGFTNRIRALVTEQELIELLGDSEVDQL